MRGVCHQNPGSRVVEVNHSLRKHKQAAKDRLNTEQGIKYRKRRPADVEPVFAQLKHNHSFRRFLLKGMSKTEVEIGLLLHITLESGKLKAFRRFYLKTSTIAYRAAFFDRYNFIP
jgi:hypothetical protein